MNDKKISFIYCVNNTEIYNENLLYINSLAVPEGYELEIIPVYDAKSICSGYNQGMGKSDAKYKVYLHQDAFIINKNFIIETVKLFKEQPNLGMLGVAGSKKLPSTGIWWETDQKYGKVYDSTTQFLKLDTFNDVIGDYESVEAIDGLIMVTQYDLHWREDLFGNWHFYDIAQSLEFIKAGYEVGIPKQQNPWVVHDCGVVEVGETYQKERQIFLDNYHQLINKSKIGNQDDYSIKKREYYKGINHSLFNLVDENAKFILEIGCAEGNLGYAIKDSIGAYVAGIEYFPPAAIEAEKKLDFVLNGDIELMDLPFENGMFDHIIFGDVLEHLKDPWGVLQKVRPFLKNTGSILACIPNIEHVSIFESLLAGQWSYTNAGLLDKTHFRFFTQKEIVKMFHGNGYRIGSIEGIKVTNERYEKLISAIDKIRESFNINNNQLPMEARSYQYVIKAFKQ